MDNVIIRDKSISSISAEHSNRIYWLGRYTERAFTTLKSLEWLYDKVIDKDPEHYKKYLECFGMPDIYTDYREFFHSFIFDENNTCSVAYSLERAYDNGIVLREEISTDAFSHLQVALDKLDSLKDIKQGLVLSLMPLEDIIYSFYGSFTDHVYTEDIRYIFYCAKALERIEMYIRLKYSDEKILPEFERMCGLLEKIPEDSPYRYTYDVLEKLASIIYSENGYKDRKAEALSLISRLFDGGAI